MSVILGSRGDERGRRAPSVRREATGAYQYIRRETAAAEKAAGIAVMGMKSGSDKKGEADGEVPAECKASEDGAVQHNAGEAHGPGSWPNDLTPAEREQEVKKKVREEKAQRAADPPKKLMLCWYNSCCAHITAAAHI